MSKRLLTGIIVAFVALFSMVAGGGWLALMLAIIVYKGVPEYVNILKNKGFLPSANVIFTSALLFGVLIYFKRFDLAPVLFTICSIAAFMGVLFKGKQPYIANVATTILGIMYCGWFPLHLLCLRNFGDTGYYLIPHIQGALYCVLLLVSVLVTDTFCYFIGCRYGKHKLSPVISPNKTIEGAIGGTVACLIFAFGIGIFIGLPWYHAIALGWLIAIFAQIGDLCESMIKRDGGVKDSSDILPGHGGFLDRTDSYILTIPVVYYYLLYFVHNTEWMDVFKGLF